jgi:hypothetical protein
MCILDHIRCVLRIQRRPVRGQKMAMNNDEGTGNDNITQVKAGFRPGWLNVIERNERDLIGNPDSPPADLPLLDAP